MPKALRSLARSLENVPFAPFAAVLFGAAAVILVIATPGWLLERGVMASGLPDMVSAAAPPLGSKARIIIALAAAFGVTGFVWLGLLPVGRWLDPKPVLSRGSRIEDNSEGAEDSAHPDALSRRPLFAESDLGAPFMSDEAIAHARETLVLETVVEDEPEPVVEPVGAIIDQTRDGEGQAPASAVLLAEPPSIAGLLDRLETALEHRERRIGSAAPVRPGDMAALRKALDSPALRH